MPYRLVGWLLPLKALLTTDRFNVALSLPLAVLTGAIFMILTDLISRTVLAPTEIPIGVITAVCGAPFFLYLLRRRKKAIF